MESRNHPTLKAASLLFVYFAAMAAGMVELSLAAGYLTGINPVTPGLVIAGVATLTAGLAFLAWSLWGPASQLTHLRPLCRSSLGSGCRGPRRSHGGQRLHPALT